MKIVKILGALLLGIILLVCAYTPIINLINLNEMPPENVQSTLIACGVTIAIGIISAVGLKLLISSIKKDNEKEKTKEPLSEAEIAEKAEKRKHNTARLVICGWVIIGVGIVAVIAVSFRPCLIGQHTYSLESTRAATCSELGEEVYICTMCKKASYTNSIPLDESAHNWGEYEIVKEASDCNVPGEKMRTCSDCGTQEVEEIQPPLEHAYGEWSFEGRNETKFEYTSTCTRCGTTGYKYEDRHKVTCKICNGTGYVKYYYGSSDWEAILSGHDPYTVGDCTTCDGTGLAYADYPWE